MMREIGTPLVAVAVLFVSMAGVVEGLPWRGQAPAANAAEQLATLKEEGAVIYARECASCHGADGQGDGAGPPLHGDAKLANKETVIRRILAGAPDTGMDPFAKVLNDRQVAAVGTFVRNSWENANGIVLETDVKPLREQIEKEKKK